MNLTTALNAGDDRIIALVGGGGKTTTMYRLARELADLGRRVIVTTTTRIYVPDPGQSDHNVCADDLASLIDETQRRLRVPGIVCVGRGVAPDGKLESVPSEWIAPLAAIADHVIVEADGSKGKPLKAPAPFEPVIPDSATLVIAVVGIDVLGLPLQEDNVHRPERVSALTGLAMDTPITTETVARVVVHPNGLAKAVPQAARLVVLLNRVHTEAHLAQAHEVASLAMEAPQHRAGSLMATVDRVIIGHVRDADPVIEVLSTRPVRR